MKAFDTNILTQILRGNPVYTDRAGNFPGLRSAVE